MNWYKTAASSADLNALTDQLSEYFTSTLIEDERAANSIQKDVDERDQKTSISKERIRKYISDNLRKVLMDNDNETLSIDVMAFLEDMSMKQLVLKVEDKVTASVVKKIADAIHNDGWTVKVVASNESKKK